MKTRHVIYTMDSSPQRGETGSFCRDVDGAREWPYTVKSVRENRYHMLTHGWNLEKWHG